MSTNSHGRMYHCSPAEIKLLRLIREEREKKATHRPLLILDISQDEIKVTTAIKTNILSNVDATPLFD